MLDDPLQEVIQSLDNIADEVTDASEGQLNTRFFKPSHSS